MPALLLGLVLFLGTHSLLILAPELRARVIAARGQGAWLLPYAAASIVGFLLIVWGYGLARQNPVPLYAPPLELRHLALAVMLPVFPLLIAAYVPGRIRATIGHPMLFATVLWGAAHLLANGTLADLLLFGGFAAWAMADWISASRRPPKPQQASKRPLANDAIAVIGGLLVYVLFMGVLHQVIIGVSPI